MTTICLTIVCVQGLHATKKVCTNVTTVDKNHILSFPYPPLFPVLPLSDGVGRTGTFICLHFQLERLKTESVVDFLQAVKASRIQRPGLVPDAVCSALSSLSINGPPYCFPHTCFVSGAKHYRVHSSSGSQKLAHGKSMT